MTAHGRRAALLGAVAALLAGCATRPDADATMPWTSGRLSVRVDAVAERPASSVSADFDLRGDSRRGELRLTSPLGSLLAATRWSPDGATLDLGRGETRYADLDSLSRDALGEVLPLRALPDWLAGRPWPDAPSQRNDEGFEQLGWSVTLTGMAEGRLDAVRAEAPRVTVRVRLDRS